MCIIKVKRLAVIMINAAIGGFNDICNNVACIGTSVDIICQIQLTSVELIWRYLDINKLKHVVLP